jgi:hypothetical protein
MVAKFTMPALPMGASASSDESQSHAYGRYDERPNKAQPCLPPVEREVLAQID